MIKRQFLDFLYEFPNPYKKIFNIKSPEKEYYQLFSSSQLLEEIENNTDLGKLILQSLETNKKNIVNMELSSKEEDFQGVLENGSFQEDKKD